MIFKDLKSGYSVYILNRVSIDVTVGKVTNVGMPRMDSRMGAPAEMVVDVTIECNDKTTTYVFKDSTEVGYAGDLMITTTKDSLLRESEAQLSQAKDALSKTDYYKTCVEKYNKILEDYNPQLREKRETDERLAKLEGAIGDIKSTLLNFVKEFKN